MMLPLVHFHCSIRPFVVGQSAEVRALDGLDPVEESSRLVVDREKTSSVPYSDKVGARI